MPRPGFAMPLTSSITPYDPQWPQRYAEEAERLSPTFGSALKEIHHVGSTAVPGLAAKPEIDILAVISRIRQRSGGMRPGRSNSFGSRRGGDPSPNHHFFKRDIGGVRTHKLHVCREGHPNIAAMLKFRDHLRRHPADRLKYQELKLALERKNADGIHQYLAGKAPFIIPSRWPRVRTALARLGHRAGSVGWRPPSPLAPQPVRHPLGNRDRREMRIRARDFRHDGGVDHPVARRIRSRGIRDRPPNSIRRRCVQSILGATSRSENCNLR